MNQKRDDRILYPMWHPGGGVDGMDQNDKPRVYDYVFTVEQAEAATEKSWGKSAKMQAPIAVDFNAQLQIALNKLDPLDKVVLAAKFGIDLSRPK